MQMFCQEKSVIGSSEIYILVKGAHIDENFYTHTKSRQNYNPVYFNIYIFYKELENKLFHTE
jgi:hypothetical protein